MANSQWTPKDYTPFFLLEEPTHSPQEIRTEYSRQRSLIMKQADRLEGIGYGLQADYLRKSMPKLSELGKDDNLIAKTLSRGKKLSEQKSYSVSGIKEIQKRIEDESGELVPLGEVLSFNEYMESWRLSAFSSMVVPSQEAADLHGEDYQNVGGTFSDFYTLYKQM